MAGDIKQVAILGAGTMGPGIAQIMAGAGAGVRLYDISADALTRAKTLLRGGVEAAVKRGTLGEDGAEALLARVEYTASLEHALDGADMVMEAIVENRDVKARLYQQLDELLPMESVIASNTSFLNIFELMPERRLPKTVIAHWYSPPQVVPLVELCPCESTEPEVLQRVAALLKRGGKSPVVMKKFIPGYIVNRLQMCLNQEVYYLLDNGYCTPEDIDVAIKASFLPRAMVLGILQKTDFGGLQMTANNYRNKSYTLPPEVDMPKTLQEHLDRGETGVAAGKGYYDYTGKDVNQLYAKRDEQLFRAYQLQKELMEDPI